MESNFMYSVFVYIGCRVRGFYHQIKRELIFADLFDELAEQFPQGKVDQLKDFIKSMGFFILDFVHIQEIKFIIFHRMYIFTLQIQK